MLRKSQQALFPGLYLLKNITLATEKLLLFQPKQPVGGFIAPSSTVVPIPIVAVPPVAPPPSPPPTVAPTTPKQRPTSAQRGGKPTAEGKRQKGCASGKSRDVKPSAKTLKAQVRAKPAAQKKKKAGAKSKKVAVPALKKPKNNKKKN